MSQLLYKIFITNVWWNSDLKDTMLFQTDDAKKAYFNLPASMEEAPLCNFPVGNLEDPVVTVRLSLDYTKVLGYNYAIIKTSSNDSMEYLFYFIDSVQNTGSDVFTIKLKMDPFVTYHNHADYSDTIIRRASLNRFYQEDNETYFDFSEYSPFLQDDDVSQLPMKTGSSYYKLQYHYANDNYLMKRSMNGYLMIFLKPESDSLASNWHFHYSVGGTKYENAVTSVKVKNTQISPCICVPILDDGYNLNFINTDHRMTPIDTLLHRLQGEILNSYIVYDDIIGDIATSVTVSDKTFTLNPGKGTTFIWQTEVDGRKYKVLIYDVYADEDLTLPMRFMALYEYDPETYSTMKAINGAGNEYTNEAKSPKTLGHGTANTYLCPMLFSSQFHKINIKYGANNDSKDFDLRFLPLNPEFYFYVSCDPSNAFQYLTPDTSETLYGDYGYIDNVGYGLTEARSMPVIDSTYSTWVADHKHYLSISNSQILASGLTNTVSSVISQGISGGGANSELGAIGSGVIQTGSGMLNNLISYKTNLASMRDLSSSMSGGSAMTTFVQPHNDLIMIEKIAYSYDLNRVYDYYYLYGYKLNRLGNIHDYENIRHYFNFIQADVETIYGQSGYYIPKGVKQQLKDAFSRGVRFWNYDRSTFDFKLENYENEVS